MENKKDKVLVFIIVIFVVISTCMGVYIAYDALNDDCNKDVKEQEADKDVTNTGKILKSYDDYYLSLEDVKVDDTITYKINDDYTVRVEIIDGFDFTFKIYINDKFILEDFNSWDEFIKLYLREGHLIYLNTGYTDIRAKHVYVIDKDVNVTEIYELEPDNPGMVPEEISISDDYIYIEGTRTDHGITIHINGAGHDQLDLDDRSDWKKYGLTEDSIIKASYTYYFENGKFNPVPSVSSPETVKEFMDLM